MSALSSQEAEGQIIHITIEIFDEATDDDRKDIASMLFVVFSAIEAGTSTSDAHLMALLHRLKMPGMSGFQ